MSAHSKPVLVVTLPAPLAALPPDVAERVDRDFVVRWAETPDTAVGMLALDNIDAVLAGASAPSLVTV